MICKFLYENVIFTITLSLFIYNVFCIYWLGNQYFTVACDCLFIRYINKFNFQHFKIYVYNVGENSRVIVDFIHYEKLIFSSRLYLITKLDCVNAVKLVKCLIFAITFLHSVKFVLSTPYVIISSNSF